MTETEKRRTELLNQTRQLYSDKYAPPAVHPRYSSVYKSLYQQEPQKSRRGSLKITVLILVLLIGAFVIVKEDKMDEVKTVIYEIKEDIMTNIPK